MSLPSSIIVVLAHFEPLFTAPTWKKVRMLLVGTLLARGCRNVTTALQQMGHQMNPQFSVFHQVLNRARWSPLEVSRRLLQVLVATFVGAGGTVEIVIDETLERRWGRRRDTRPREVSQLFLLSIYRERFLRLEAVLLFWPISNLGLCPKTCMRQSSGDYLTLLVHERTHLRPLPQPEQGHDFLSAHAALGKHVCFRYSRLYLGLHFEMLFNMDLRIHTTYPFRKIVFFSF